MVPPVPAPHTKPSRCLLHCSHTSWPVCRCALKFAKFSNWSAKMLLGCCAALQRATLTKWSGFVMETGRILCTVAPARQTTQLTVNHAVAHDCMHAHAELRKAKWQDHGYLLQEKLWLAQIIRCVQYADCPMKLSHEMRDFASHHACKHCVMEAMR